MFSVLRSARYAAICCERRLTRLTTIRHGIFGASKMRKLSLTIAIAAAVVGLLAFSDVARAADVGVYSRGAPARVATGGHCSRQWICGPESCGWQKFCRLGCPDRYSCSSLYGAYGPYGGTGYWSRYTAGGWGSSYYYR